MNFRMIGYIICWVLKIEGAFMVLPCIISLIYREWDELVVYLICMAVIIAIGFAGTAKKPGNQEIYMKDGFVAVALCWVVMSLFGAIPFVLTGEIPSYLDAVFEIVSGFTTTGATILPDVEALSHTSLLWRSFSHWIGGMGVLVFILMLMPTRSGLSMNLMRAESPGPEVSKFVPRVRNTAILLYKIYIGMTLAEIAALLISGMHWFDTACISMGTAGTGGFGVLNSSCADYTPAQQWIITVFMILFGVSFTLYYLIIKKKLKMAFQALELRVYIILIAASTVFITINVLSFYSSGAETVRHAAFQVGSIISTTGFSTTDFNLWPQFSKMILLILMFSGACAGSTGGGIKVSRLIILFKSIKSEINGITHPRIVKNLTVDGRVLDNAQIRTTRIYLAAYTAIVLGSLLVISFDGFSFETNFSAVAATLNNIGPGFDMVGPLGTYAAFGAVSKIVLIFNMIAGRLELFPVLLLFFPATWNRKV